MVNLLTGAGALVTNIRLKWTLIIKQIIVYIFENKIILGTFLWHSIKKKVRQINVELALPRKTTSNTGSKTKVIKGKKYPYPPTPNEQVPTNPVRVKVAVNPVNLVGRRSIGFNTNYEWEFPALGVTKTAMTNRRTTFTHTRHVNTLHTCLLSTRSTKLSLKE